MLRLLANENVPGDAVKFLRDRGHDVTWARTDMPGAGDDEVLARANLELRLLLTFDKDFGEWVFRHGHAASPGVVLMRLGAASANELCRKVVATFDACLDWNGKFSVVEPGRIRQVPLP